MTSHKGAQKLFAIGVTVCVSMSPSGGSSQTGQHASEMCRKARTATDKISHCSNALQVAQSPEMRERHFLRRGNAFMELGQFNAALSDFTGAITLNPKIAGYYDNRASALKALGRYDEALTDANRSVAIAPTHAFVYRTRGLIYEALARYDAAIIELDRASRIDPRDVGLIVDRARMKVKAGRGDEAIFELTGVIERDPSKFSAYKERGFALVARGDRHAALSDFSFYARAHPQDEDVLRAIKKLEVSTPSPREALQPPPQQPRPVLPRSGGAVGTRTSSGTGFFVSTEGHIVTNAHVVSGCSIVRAASNISSAVDALVLARDVANDLALLKAEVRPTRTGNIRVGVRIGEAIAAFGYPLYGLLATSGNFTLGNISAVAGLRDDSRYLQISAPIQPGNSGGPVLDQSGNVVGVVVSKLNVLRVASAIDDVPQNVNFALKSAVLGNFLEANGIVQQTRISQEPLAPADIAEQAKAISIFLSCDS